MQVWLTALVDKPVECGWQVKLCDPLLTHAIPGRLRDEQLIINRYEMRLTLLS